MSEDLVKKVPFKADHLDILEFRELEKEFFGQEHLEKFKALAQTGYAVTMVYDGRIIAVCGFLELWPGVLQVWLLPSRYVDEYGIIYARVAKRLLDVVVKDIPCHRVQTEAYADERHNRWMKFLGFQYEGTMYKYSAKREHYNLWARTT